jgi:excisionase family DNA binding protein
MTGDDMSDFDTAMPWRETVGAGSAYLLTLNGTPDVLMTQREAAKLLQLSGRTLERYRASGTGPRYIALGRAIRYRRHDLADWVERAARQSTSERR